MKESHKLALIVAYYLSRCDREAVRNLGYSTFAQATKEIGTILGVKQTTIKNMRDEFDPYHDNSRVGWLRPAIGSRAKVMQTFQDTDDDTLHEIVKEILSNKTFSETEAYTDITALLSEPDQKKNHAAALGIYIPRGATGRSAENLFREYFEREQQPVAGTLIDRRDEGCGYDFEIRAAETSYFIEVKGLAAEEGSILFTNKEWNTALRAKEKYYVVLVRDISNNPVFEVIQNPATQLTPKKNIYTTLQLSWAVSSATLKSLRAPQK
jgi:hypothetical protein